MATFSYKAVDKFGSSKEGAIEAVSKKTAIASLADKGFYATSILESTKSLQANTNSAQGLRGKIKSKDVLAFTLQLSTAINAGLGVLEAINVVGKQQKNNKIHTVLDEICVSISGGDSLSQALGKRPDVFSNLYVSMVRSGESAGILDKTLAQLTELLAREEEIKTRLKNASIYPATVLGVGLISIVIVVQFVMPKILATIKENGTALPLPTRMLLGMSDFLQAHWLGILIALAIAVFAYIKYQRTREGRILLDGLKLKVPYFGSLSRSIAVGRFTKTLGALLGSGITILDALKVVRDTLGNVVLCDEMKMITEKVKTGCSLAESLEESTLFPPLLTQIVSVGEHTGKLDEMLLNAAQTFDGEADSSLERFMAIFPVLLIVFLGVIVLFLVMATLLPILMMSMGSGVV